MTDRRRQLLVIILSVTQLITNFGATNSGEVSDSFFTYLIPAGYTFAVWGPIYLGLTAYAVYQALPTQAERTIHRRIGWIAALVAAGNAAWTPVFVVNGTSPTIANIGPTLVIIVLMLIGLATIFVRLRSLDDALSQSDRWLVQIPFYGYFAWVTVATIVNATIVLISLGFEESFLGIEAVTWSVVLQTVAVIIFTRLIVYSAGNYGTVAYALVAVWAFVGIYNGNVDRSLVAGNAALVAAAVVAVVATVRVAYRVRSGTNRLANS